jgi:DNA-binding MarR family transcriptional regulator
VAVTGGTHPGGAHPRHRLDPVVHFPIRLSIMACLAEVAEAEFGFVKDTVEISAATLSKQVTVLEESGYLAVRKGYVGRRPRTWLSLTDAGRRALAGYLDALREIAGGAAG